MDILCQGLIFSSPTGLGSPEGTTSGGVVGGEGLAVIALSIGATGVAHGIHYAVLAVGVVGLLALLGPQLVGRPRPAAPYDEHSRRVQALAAQISSGNLGVRVAPPVLGPVPRYVDRVRARYLPVAVVSSAAAAGVHAAVGPEHFREQVLFGLFFVGAALAQIVWAVLMATRPQRSLLVAAVVGNSAVLVLWLVTRTVGLPGLLPAPEAVGVWDLACGAWELVVVLCAARALQAHTDPGADPDADLRLPAWVDWETSARAWALASVLVLLALTLSGAGA